MGLAPQPGKPLSPREIECLGLIAQGGSDISVGRKLGISERTARFHVINASIKLRAKTRAHLVMLAIAAGVLTP